jgi:hypothetical protein
MGARRAMGSVGWPTKHSLLMTNYEPKSPSRRAGDRSDEKNVIVRGALILAIVPRLIGLKPLREPRKIDLNADRERQRREPQ